MNFNNGRTVPLVMPPHELDWSQIWVRRSAATGDQELAVTLLPRNPGVLNPIVATMLVTDVAKSLADPAFVDRQNRSVSDFRSIRVTGLGDQVFVGVGGIGRANTPVWLLSNVEYEWPRDIAGVFPIPHSAEQRLFPWHSNPGLPTATPLEQVFQVGAARGTYVIEWTPLSGASSLVIQLDEIHGGIYVPQPPQTFTGVTGVQRRMVDLTEGQYRLRVEASGASLTTFSAAVVSYNV